MKKNKKSLSAETFVHPKISYADFGNMISNEELKCFHYRETDHHWAWYQISQFPNNEKRSCFMVWSPPAYGPYLNHYFFYITANLKLSTLETPKPGFYDKLMISGEYCYDDFENLLGHDSLEDVLDNINDDVARDEIIFNLNLFA